jgi:DNA-binding NarL/FixJ family response regulator
VLIADDNPELRDALNLLVSREPRYTVVGEVATIAGLLSVAKAAQPAVILLDLALPRLSAAVLHQLRDWCSGVRIVGLTSRGEPEPELRSHVDVVVREVDGPSGLLNALE